MKVLVNIEGGLGKNIMAVTLMKQLKEKYDEIYIISPYYDLFEACPYVLKAFPVGQPGLYEQLILKEDIEILWKEPYNNSNFIKKKCHLLEAWSKEFDIDYNNKLTPKIDVKLLRNDIIENINNILKKIKGKFIIVQFSGGQSPLDGAEQNVYQEVLKRNYHKADDLVQSLKNEYTIIHFGLKNEPKLKDTLQFEIPYIWYIELIKKAEFVISIDSSLQHLAACTETPTYVLWGETRPEHFGWSQHTNFAEPIEDTAPYFKPLGTSPIFIDFTEPKKILNTIEENKKNA